MAFNVSTYRHPAISQHEPTIFVLEDETGSRAEVWPGLGFSCFRWRAIHQGRPLEVLFHDPDTLFNGDRPTRSGIPVLFPFPNRIRGGRFSWDGKEYRLPPNDPAGKNAIHGFVCRRPWRVTGQGSDISSAWVTGTFLGSVDAPECVALWPTDYQIVLTLRLTASSLLLEAEVSCPGGGELPFGLGYHPYFAMPFAEGVGPDDCRITVPARSFWVLEESLPTGEVRAVDDRLDLNGPRPFATLQLDDVLTDLPTLASSAEGLVPRARVLGAPGAALHVSCSPAFRELVVFTPPHRQAFSVEPYTCTTDAVNLEARGVNAGWQVVPAGQVWRGVVEFRLAGE